MKVFSSLFILLMSINLLAEAPQMAPSLSYQELQKIKSTPPSYHAYFGYSVAIDGNTAVIGAYGFNSIAGEAYIYQYDEVTKMFLEKAILTTSSPNSSDHFGISVAISGDTVVVGAYGEDKVNTNSGAAYIYEKPFLSDWIDTNQPDAKLKASDADGYDNFGYSVSISGDTVIVGAWGDDETNTDSGAAYIYKKPIGGWSDILEDAKLKASDANVSDNFGRSVAISGDTVVIGADNDDEINTDSGAAYIYKKPSGTWSNTAEEDAKLKASDANVSDNFGRSVAISGDTVLVGAWGDDEINTDSGAAYLYEKPLLSDWRDTAEENAKLKASDANVSDYFGGSVAICGDTVIIGADGDSEISTRSGAAYIYEKPPLDWSDTAQEDAKLKASDADSDDSFGVSVAISGDTLLIGAYRDDSSYDDDSGAIYIEKVRNSPSNAAIIMYLLQ